MYVVVVRELPSIILTLIAFVALKSCCFSFRSCPTGTVSDPTPIPPPRLLSYLISISDRINFFQFIVTCLKNVIFAYFIGIRHNNMSNLEDNEIEYELKLSQKGRDDVESPWAIGPDWLCDGVLRIKQRTV